MRRAATISAAKMALCVINIIPPAWAQDRPDVVDRSTEDTNHHVSQLVVLWSLPPIEMPRPMAIPTFSFRIGTNEFSC